MKKLKRGDLVVLRGEPHCPQSIAVIKDALDDGEVLVQYLSPDRVSMPVLALEGEFTRISELEVEVDFAGTDFILCRQSRAEGAPRAKTWKFNHDWMEVRPWLAEIAIQRRTECANQQ